MTTILAIEPPFEPDEVLQQRYKDDPVFRKLADRIHHSRMMGGRACEQCMQMAANQIDAIKPKNSRRSAKP